MFGSLRVIIGLLIVFSFYEIARSDFSNSISLYVFRIAQSSDPTPSLGHCTGWIVPGTRRIVTAAHCYHNEPFKVVDSSGSTIVELIDGDYAYTESLVGILDIFLVDNVSESNIEAIKRTVPALNIVVPSNQTILAGFPISLRDKPISIIDCEYQSQFANNFRLQLEKAIGIENLSCTFRNSPNNDYHSTLDINHENVKGLSGGPAVYPDGTLGVAFHLIKEFDTKLETVKTISLSTINAILPSDVGKRKYQLNKKTFEQVKVPNSLRIDFDLHMMNKAGLVGSYLSNVSDVDVTEDGIWHFTFTNGSKYFSQRDIYPANISKALEIFQMRYMASSKQNQRFDIQPQESYVMNLLPDHNFKKNQLPWPVGKAVTDLRLGNLMAQFQSYFYGYQYFHGGVDIPAEVGSEVYSPVDGKVEAGFYMYLKDKDGYHKKNWIPFGQHRGKDEQVRNSGFEIAIVHSSGYRFELHHIDRENIPKNILQKLETGEEVRSGDIVGYVGKFHTDVLGQPYHHIHYNIVSPGGIRLNPEWFSLPIPDQQAPIIQNVYALKNGQTIAITEKQTLNFEPEEIIIDSYDQKNDLFYKHQPHSIKMSSAIGLLDQWNFEYALMLPDGNRPAIFDYFAEFLSIDGEKSYTEGDYEKFRFQNRLKWKAGTKGNIVITVKDANENTSTFQFSVRAILH